MDYRLLAEVLEALRSETGCTQKEMHAEFRRIGGDKGLRMFRSYLRGTTEPQVTVFILMTYALDNLGSYEAPVLKVIADELRT